MSSHDKSQALRTQALKAYFNELASGVFHNNVIFNNDRGTLVGYSFDASGYKLKKADQPAVDEFTTALNTHGTRPVIETEIHEESNSLIFHFTRKSDDDRGPATERMLKRIAHDLHETADKIVHDLKKPVDAGLFVKDAQNTAEPAILTRLPQTKTANGNM